MHLAGQIRTRAAKWVIVSFMLGFLVSPALAAPQRSTHNKHSSSYVTSSSSTTATAPSVTTQPASCTVTAGQTATFMVASTGTAPLAYQWRKNNTAIIGATSSTYTTPATTVSDTGAQFTVVISNSAGGSSSKAATLTVNAATSLLNSSSTNLAFGTVTVSSSNTLNVTLTNTGTSTVTISNVAVTGAGFNATGASGLMLSSGQTATLSATFVPSAAGTAAGSIKVTSNASNSPTIIALSGTGQAQVSHLVALTWVPSTSTVTGYNVYSSTVSGGPYARLTPAPVPATNYTDSSVQQGLTYYYVVTAVNSQNQESADSGQVYAAIP
jgi:hypothetical protein